MARAERILAIDIGATSIKVGEFEYPPKEGPTLIGFTHREYEEELTESSRSLVVAGLLRQMLVENNFISRRCLLSISGQAAFTRFVRLPPVAEEEKRVRQIVEFEARQNVPFPMEEVIWDYQLIANPEAEEMDVMFVVIKNEIVEQMTSAVQAVGLEPILVDVAPAACYNAARANHVGDTDCAMVLNIGGRSTNLLFADKNRFFARTIPIAGHSITQQIGKEFGIGFAEAEELKRRHGFVALGGAYAEPESEVAASVSKIIRNVMARLHGEINRSISVYRAHQKGNRPTALFLTGGSSTMTYTDHFFAEKLRMEVSYLNPFQVVNISPAVDRQKLQEVAHMFSEVVGLALRHKMQCPIEVSLIPESIRRQQMLKRKKPFLVACLACWLVVLFVALLATQRRATLYRSAHEVTAGYIEKLDRLDRQIQEAEDRSSQRRRQYDAVREFLQDRQRWPQIIDELYRLKPDHVWLVSVQPVVGEMTGISASSGREARGHAGGGMGGMPGMPGMAGVPGAPGGGPEGGMDMGAGMEGGGAMFEGSGHITGKPGVVKITGVEIVGHSVKWDTSPAASRAGAQAVPAPAPGAAAPGAAAPGAAAPAAAPGAAPLLAPGAKAATPAAAPAAAPGKAGAAPAPAARPATPELAYLANLRGSELFDNNEQFTGIRSYMAPSAVPNLSSFAISVKLKKPIEYPEIKR